MKINTITMLCKKCGWTSYFNKKDVLVELDLSNKKMIFTQECDKCKLNLKEGVAI